MDSPAETLEAKPVGKEQGSDDKLKALVHELNVQDHKMRGRLLIRLPLSESDATEVLVFNGVSKTRRPHAGGVHPERGPFSVRVESKDELEKIKGMTFAELTESKRDELTFVNPLDELAHDPLTASGWKQSYASAKGFAFHDLGELRSRLVDTGGRFLPEGDVSAALRFVRKKR